MFPVEAILHPTDFSEQAGTAFQVACSLARDHDARLIVLHVAPSPECIPAEEAAHPEVFYEALEMKLRAIHATCPSVRLEHRLEEGAPADRILRVARQTNCDLIVMGTHGRTGLLDRLLLGSVAESVVRLAACPVLTVKSLPAKACPVAALSGHAAPAPA